MLRRGKSILSVAYVVKVRGTAMEEIVSKPDNATVGFRHKSVNRFAGAEEALPCCHRDLLRKSSWTTAAIEFVVAIPEWAPASIVFASDRTDVAPLGHGGAESGA